MTAAKMSGDELLEKISPRKRTARTSICLRTDLVDAWEQANEDLQAIRAKDIGAGRLTNGGVSAASKKAAEKVAALEEEIAESQMWFEFTNMDPHEHSELRVQFPPRKNDPYDMMVGYNRDELEDAAVRHCLVEPKFSDEGWDRLISVMPPGEWSELRRTCNEVNGRQGSLPKSSLAEQILAAKRGSVSSSPRAGG